MKDPVFRIIRPLACALLAAALVPAGADAQTNDGVLAVRGAVEQPLTLAVADLQAMPRTKLTAHEKDGSEAAFEGVALYEILSRAKPILSDKCCSNAINTVVVIKAADNYQATFSLAEIDPKIGKGEILVADRRAGQPLRPPQGPLQIIVPGDEVHARWVRQVNLIEVLHVGDLRGASTNAPSP